MLEVRLSLAQFFERKCCPLPVRDSSKKSKDCQIYNTTRHSFEECCWNRFENLAKHVAFFPSVTNVVAILGSQNPSQKN